MSLGVYELRLRRPFPALGRSDKSVWLAPFAFLSRWAAAR